MKIRAHNELVFTVFFREKNASKRMRDIFKETYGRMDKAFTGIEPKAIYDSGSKEYTIK